MIVEIPKLTDLKELVKTCFPGDQGCPSRRLYKETGLSYQAWMCIHKILKGEPLDMTQEQIIDIYRNHIIPWLETSENYYPQVFKKFEEYSDDLW